MALTKKAKRNKKIKKVIYCFWTGTNTMSQDRQNRLNELITKSGCPVKLVDVHNLHKFILPKHPLHEGYQYLSETHKADYLRTYFMHFLGGGYSDIKATTADWNDAFNDINNNKDMYLNGYHELGPDGVAGDASLKEYWKELPGNCAYIVRPNTEFTKKWYGLLIQKMDEKLERLKKYPAKHPQNAGSGHDTYPIAWAEILGEIFHKHSCNYRGKFLFTVPIPNLSNYR